MSIELLDLNSSGIKFHSLGATTANALSPYVFSLAFEVGKKKRNYKMIITITVIKITGNNKRN